MKAIIQEIILDFQKYNGKSALLLILAACLVFLCIVEKNRRIKNVFVYLVIALLLVFICPLYGMAAKKIDSEIYYRVLWTIPIGVLFCYSMIKLFAYVKKPWGKGFVFALAVLIIVLNGDFVYTKTLHFKAGNQYHMPEVVMHISDSLAMEQYTPTVVLPAELLPFVRQYSAEFFTEYGRNILETQWNFSHTLYDAMETSEYDTALIAKEAREHLCFYVVLSSVKPQIGSMEENGYVYLSMCDGYYIYFDKAIFEELKSQNMLSDEEAVKYESAISKN